MAYISYVQVQADRMEHVPTLMAQLARKLNTSVFSYFDRTFDFGVRIQADTKEGLAELVREIGDTKFVAILGPLGKPVKLSN